jgi:energy-coupling factor transport system ATP-binding protein
LPIVLRDLCFSYDRDPVIDDVSLAIKQGLIHLVMGPTGCGKTTLALLLVGLLRPQKGSVLVDGADPAGRDFSRQAIQLAFQFPEAQMFELTVEREIVYGLKNFGLAAGECEERCRRALDCVGLPHEFLNRDPHSLSFGERRKVALASVIAIEPAYLILDEPLAGLDWDGRKSLVAAIENLKERGVTSVILTHETDLLGEMGDTVLVMEGGEISRPRPVPDFLYPEPGPNGPNVPEFIRVVKIMSRRGIRIPGRPYRIKDVVGALIKAFSGQVDF